MTGGLGADTFRAFAGEGSDVITDFNPGEGDRIRLDAGSAYTASQSGSDVLLDLGGGSELVLRNMSLGACRRGGSFRPEPPLFPWSTRRKPGRFMRPQTCWASIPVRASSAERDRVWRPGSTSVS